MIWDKIKNKTYIFIAFITAFVFFYPLFFSGQTLYLRDIHAIFYPMKYFLAQSLKSGTIPFGNPANIIRLNYLFQGVEVDSGKQQIQFEYQPPFFRSYLLISFFTFFVIILYWVFRYSLKRKILQKK
jgi:uncharacterized membrane protein YfhO